MRKILLSNREKEVIRIVLELLSGGIVLTAAFMAPGVAGAFVKLYEELWGASTSIRSKALYDMKRRGYIDIRDDREGSWLVLTKKGRLRLQKYKLEMLEIRRPRIWDKRWRIVFFDVPRKPQSLNRARDVFRDTLKRLGFVKIQKSVWVHSFPCEEEIYYVAETYGLQPYVRIAVANSVTGEEKLQRKFDL